MKFTHTSNGSLVILSGGLDSTVCMAIARKAESGNLVAVTFDYGQKARVEIDRAAQIAGHYGCEHLVVALDVSRWGGSSLVDPGLEIPSADQGQQGSIPNTYVPARNIIFLSVALGICEARDLSHAYIGVNSLDYSGYPDCRPEFIEAFSKVARVGQKRGIEGNPVSIVTPLISMSKAEIIEVGQQLNAPLGLSWSCYNNFSAPCGTCESCYLRSKGFSQVGIEDESLI